uniref:Uncharacterized protein n=1 Tax=Aegilops tauschii subsp. strangulata TaxID=200361 RepID=A0A453GWI4_AEGTS
AFGRTNSEEKKNFVSGLMEGKAILLCLMVIAQLANSIHV